MEESRTIRDPFLNKDVQISNRLTDRLRGRYANGPTLANGEPEFGWREFQTAPIQHEAATEIDRLTALCDRLKLEAQVHAQEARGANATIAEIYQIITGKTGEPGNWNGARPVRTEVDRLRASAGAERTAIAERAREIASHYPEASDGRNTFILLAEWIEAREGR